MTAPAAVTWSLLALIFLLSAADLPLGIATRYAGSGYGQNLVAFIVLLPVALVGFVVARRQPGNPIGWMLLGLVALLAGRPGQCRAHGPGTGPGVGVDQPARLKAAPIWLASGTARVLSPPRPADGRAPAPA
jgi:hypothetical protein